MVPRDESHQPGSRSNASTLQEVKGSHNVYYDPETGKHYRKQQNPAWNWTNKDKVPSEIYVELAVRPGGTAYFVGEGDFSYSKAYAKENPNTLLKATSYDNEKEINKYPQGKDSLSTLKKSDMVAVQHGVDVMLSPGSDSGAMSPRPVSLLQFNFPHTGTGSGSADKDSLEFETFVTDNQNLIRGFFKNAQHKVAPNGAVRFTYKKQGPYLEWKVEKIAAEEGWDAINETPFIAPTGYKHVLTKTADGTVSDDGAVTITFKRTPQTDATTKPLGSAFDAHDLERRLGALQVGESLGKTEKQRPELKTNYYKEKTSEGQGVIKIMPKGNKPGFIRRKGKNDIAFFEDGMEEGQASKLNADTKISFVIVKDKSGRDKAVSVKAV